MDNTLSGTWSLILGASGGMGRACALALAEAGSNVIGVHLDTAERKAAVDELTEEIRAAGVAAHFFNENAASDSGRARILAAARELAAPAGVRVFMHSLAFGSLVPFLPAAGGADQATATRAQMDMTLSVMAHSLVYWTQDLLTSALLGPGG